jgi:hypothetical protein
MEYFFSVSRFVAMSDEDTGSEETLNSNDYKFLFFIQSRLIIDIRVRVMAASFLSRNKTEDEVKFHRKVTSCD